jgi:hypothetical protein
MTQTITDSWIKKGISIMPNKNTRLIIGSNKLFTYNNILTQFAYDHDIITYTYNDKLSLKANTKIVYKNISYHIRQDYDSIVFMGTHVDSNLLYGLYDDKNLVFDAGVLVNYKTLSREGEVDLDTQWNISKETDIYTFNTNKKDTLPPVAHLKDHQYVPSILGNVRSRRLAMEIFGCVVYGTYNINGLEGANSVLV